MAVQRKPALAGIKVVEMGWVVLAPLICKMLGDYGAEVVKVESHSRPDIVRAFRPFTAGKPGMNRSGMYSTVNSSKYGMGLNLSRPKGVEVLKRLITWSDVLVQNFTPGQMAKWGLDYEDIIKFKPDIVMVSLSIQGLTGPYASQPGLGNFFQGMIGFNELSGWPDQEPQCPFPAYPDYVAPWYALVGILGALAARRRTGRGTHIDLSQLETCTQFVAPTVLDCAANGRQQRRLGNRLSSAAPHGAFRCKGDDRWCAIGVFSDGEWQTFCRVLGARLPAGQPRFATIAGRKQNEDELEKVVQAYTVDRKAEDLMLAMQAAGVSAGTVQSNADVCDDINLRQRGYLQMLDHPEMGPSTHILPAYRLSRTPPAMRPSPCLGEHTDYVCKEMLHMSDEEFVELSNEGILE